MERKIQFYDMKQTTSAGGVVINPNGEIMVVNQHGNSWSLPKGHIEPGEDALTAARREIYEESGVNQLEFVRELGTYQRHPIGPGGAGEIKEIMKTMIFFLFRASEVTPLKPLDPENPEARWVEPNKVAELLTHPQDKAFFLSIKNLL